MLEFSWFYSCTVTAILMLFSLCLVYTFVPKIAPTLGARFFYWKSYLQTVIFYLLYTKIRSIAKFFIQLQPHCSDRELTKNFVEMVVAKKLGDSNIKLKNIAEKEVVNGGFTGETYRIKLEWQQEKPGLPASLVVKTVKPKFSSHLASIMLGSAREALFYKDNTLKKDPPSYLPPIFYAEGSILSGEFIVIMQDLGPTCVQGGHLFGNQCWGPITLPEQVKLTDFQALEIVFLQIADIHARYWRDPALLSKQSYFKHSQWLQGKDRESWEFGMKNMRYKWDVFQQAVSNNKISCPWSSQMLSAIGTAFKNTSWSAFRKHFNIAQDNTPFTLCHGDFHAGNMLWDYTKNQMFLVDWSEVGVFCPFTDLSQFVISHVKVETRREHEKRLFALYHARLIEKGISAKLFPLNECWDRYVSGGIERWLQMLLLLAMINFEDSNNFPEFAMKWFYGQVEAFVADHYETCKRHDGFMTCYCL